MAETKLWLLKGQPTAPGWKTLQADSMSQRTRVVHFDPDRWALVEAAEAPAGYEGLTPSEPADGTYLDNFGRPLYVVGCHEVISARKVIAALGPEAEELLDRTGDGDLVLERLGRVY